MFIYSLAKLLKDWTLPISMLVGSVCYVVFTRCEWALPVKPVIIRCIVGSEGSASILWSIVVIIGMVVGMQFYVDKQIGSHYNDRIAAGQGLAQKNTVLSIWIAMTFLSPTAAIGPGVCLLWQNIVNSWQIWNHGRKS